MHKLREVLRRARLKHNACLEDIDYRAPRGLDKALIAQLATGMGKTSNACALAHQACRQGYTTRYLRFPRLFEDLCFAHPDARFPDCGGEVWTWSRLI